MHYIVIDLEWNQAARRNEGNPGLQFEIIEIGAVKLDEDFCVVDEFDRLVCPVVYKELYYRIRAVVHMSSRMLKEEGVPFHQAVKEFFDWCGEDVSFCTWGTMDLTEFQKNIS
ncbi:MAG: exonuclease domain-containing protein, partial [Parasporobacterium sp.]|nr:exonuclease domain-containing protein [Parasporobacterium sp.]